MSPTRRLFQAIWDVEQAWMPNVRALPAEAERNGKSVIRLASVEEPNRFIDATQIGSSLENL